MSTIGVIPYGIQVFRLCCNGLPFVLRFFAAVTTRLGIKQLTMTTYHPQTSGDVERFNRTIVARLPHYVTTHETDRDLHMQLLTCAYNAQVYRSTGTTAFSLVLCLQPPGPSTANPVCTIPDSMTEPQQLQSFYSLSLRQLDVLPK